MLWLWARQSIILKLQLKKTSLTRQLKIQMCLGRQITQIRAFYFHNVSSILACVEYSEGAYKVQIQE